MSLACLAHVNFLLHMYFDLITEQINDDDDDNNNNVRQLLSRAVTWEGHYKGAVQSLYNCHYH